MGRFVTDQDEHLWRWLYARWPRIGYRTKRVIFAVMRCRDYRWHPTGSGTDLRFERLIEIDSPKWPHDLEVVTVSFDVLGRLKAVRREKVIVVETGRSHADLCRMLDLDEVSR